jgi:hypothetical protein
MSIDYLRRQTLPADRQRMAEAQRREATTDRVYRPPSRARVAPPSRWRRRGANGERP